MGIVLDMAAIGPSVFQQRITGLIKKWQGSPMIAGPDFMRSLTNLNQDAVNGQNYPLHDQASPVLQARIELVPDSTPSSLVKSAAGRPTPDSMEYKALERGAVAKRASFTGSMMLLSANLGKTSTSRPTAEEILRTAFEKAVREVNSGQDSDTARLALSSPDQLGGSSIQSRRNDISEEPGAPSQVSLRSDQAIPASIVSGADFQDASGTVPLPLATSNQRADDAASGLQQSDETHEQSNDEESNLGLGSIADDTPVDTHTTLSSEATIGRKRKRSLHETSSDDRPSSHRAHHCNTLTSSDDTLDLDPLPEMNQAHGNTSLPVAEEDFTMLDNQDHPEHCVTTPLEPVLPQNIEEGMSALAVSVVKDAPRKNIEESKLLAISARSSSRARVVTKQIDYNSPDPSWKRKQKSKSDSRTGTKEPKQPVLSRPILVPIRSTDGHWDLHRITRWPDSAVRFICQ